MDFSFLVVRSVLRTFFAVGSLPQVHAPLKSLGFAPMPTVV